MKKINLLVAVMFVVFCGTTMAQSKTDAYPYGKNKFTIGYIQKSIDSGDDANAQLAGAVFGYSRLFELSEQLPVFAEVGASAAFMKDEYKDFGDKEKLGLGQILIPANVGYNFNFDNFTVSPYAGLTFNWNVEFESKYTSGGVTETTDLLDFSKETMLGWQIGVAAGCKQFVLDIRYGTDFTKLISIVPSDPGRNFSITLGYRW